MYERSLTLEYGWVVCVSVVARARAARAESAAGGAQAPTTRPATRRSARSLRSHLEQTLYYYYMYTSKFHLLCLYGSPGA